MCGQSAFYLACAWCPSGHVEPGAVKSSFSPSACNTCMMRARALAAAAVTLLSHSPSSPPTSPPAQPSLALPGSHMHTHARTHTDFQREALWSHLLHPSLNGTVLYSHTQKGECSRWRSRWQHRISLWIDDGRCLWSSETTASGVSVSMVAKHTSTGTHRALDESFPHSNYHARTLI